MVLNGDFSYNDLTWFIGYQEIIPGLMRRMTTHSSETYSPTSKMRCDGAIWNGSGEISRPSSWIASSERSTISQPFGAISHP